MSALTRRIQVALVAIAAAAQLSCSSGSLVGPPVTIQILPQNLSTIVQGGVVQLEADIRDGSGNRLSLQPEWSSSNEAVATISSSGLLTAKAFGATTITARRDGIAAQRTIAVVALAGG